MTHALVEQFKKDKKWKTVGRMVKGGEVRSEIQKRVPTIEPVKIPSAVIARTTTLYDADGKAALQWVQEKPEDKQRVELWQEVARGMAADLPREQPRPAPIVSNFSLMTCYPVGDHHMGMLAWKQETGASYDLDIGEGLLSNAFEHLTAVAPASPMATIVFLGDFFHYDSPDPKTPTNNNVLDSDGRFPKMVRAGIRTMRTAINLCLKRHHNVHVIVEIGNHDLYSSVFLMECLHNVYEQEPRVSVDTSPKHFHYFVHGRTLVGTHHGHGPKPEQLPIIMATDRQIDWGSSAFRYWWTGHIHTKRAWDFPGCSVESFRILPPSDAWAANKGYRNHRSMEAVVLHDKYGEVARYSVNPQMLEDA